MRAWSSAVSGRGDSLLLPALLVGFVGAILSLALVVRLDGALGFERSMLVWVQAWNLPVFSDLLPWVSTVTGKESRFVLIPLAVLALLLAGRTRSAWAFAAAVAIVSVTAVAGDYLLGQLAGRFRPLPGSTELSFPSAHTYGTTLFFGALAFLIMRHRMPSFLRTPALGVLGALILTVGPSRMFLNMHWPADVVAGYMYGLVFLAVLIGLYLWFERLRWTVRLPGVQATETERLST